MSMKITQHGNIQKSHKGTQRQSCAFPGICILPGGRWICSFRAAPFKAATTGQHALLTWSDDEGRTWSNPIVPFSPARVDGKPGLFRNCILTSLNHRSIIAVLCWVDHSNPVLPFFNEETEGLLDTRIFISYSEDMGETWSTPALMDTKPFHVPTALTGPVLKLDNGCLACQFELNKHYYDPVEWRHSSVMMFSCDGGKSWPESVIVSNDPSNRLFYWDQRPAVLNNGYILDFFWTFDKIDAVYLNIHARLSKDHGRSWSDIWDTGLPGQPASPVSMSDGSIFMVYVDRTTEPVIKARQSFDLGRTWPDKTEIVLYQTSDSMQTMRKQSMKDAWAEMGKYSIGLPATAALPNDEMIVVFYAGKYTDETGIQWIRVQQNKNYQED